MSSTEWTTMLTNCIHATCKTENVDMLVCVRISSEIRRDYLLNIKHLHIKKINFDHRPVINYIGRMAALINMS